MSYANIAWTGHADHIEPRADCHLCAAFLLAHGAYWARAHNDRGQRDPQLAVERHEEGERAYVASLRRIGK